MTDKQPFNRALLKKGATVHFRCGGSDEVNETYENTIKFKSGYISTWDKNGAWKCSDCEHPIDIIAITPAKERERLSGFVQISDKKARGIYTSFTGGDSNDETILDLSDCYHENGTPWCVGDGK